MRGAWLGMMCLVAGSLSAGAAMHKAVTVPMKDGSGASVGKVTITETGKIVYLHVAVKGLPAGEHGIHVHATGVCTGPDFASAGGHLNPDGKKHGYANPMGHHAGDFAMSVAVKDNGVGVATLRSTDLSLDPASPDSVFGKAIVIHELADDQKTDPAGASGKRIACGVIPAK